MTHPAQQPDDDATPKARPSGDTPDWRVSADEGAEYERHATPAPDQPRPSLRLTTSNDLSSAMPVERPVASRPEQRSTGPKPWTAAASSVPKLRVEAAPARPLADAGGDLDPQRPARSAPARATEPDRSSDYDDLQEAEDDGFLDRGPRAARTPPPVLKLDEPFWIVALDALQSSRRVQMLLVGGIVVVLAAWMMVPKGDPGVSLHDLKAHPARWDGQTIKVKGRVGEVFHVGAGWAFNLHQGRDTIVVFTRGARPESREKMSISGSVSTGWLDGQPRQAIFATE